MPTSHAWPPVLAVLQKDTDARYRRLPVPRSVEQVVQQRLAQIGDQAARSPLWQEHQLGSGHISVHFTLMDTARSVLAEVDDQGWLLHVSVSTAEVCGLEPVEVGLRVVATIDAVVGAVAKELHRPLPPALPRSKREWAWLEAGGHNPGPAVTGALRVRAQQEGLTAAQAWKLIGDAPSAALEATKGRVDPDPVAEAARQLLRSVDTPQLRTSAEAVLGALSPDAWETVRAWLILQGRQTVNRVTQDPAVLRGLLEAVDEDSFATAEAVLYPSRD